MVKKYILGIVTVIIIICITTFICVNALSNKRTDLVNTIEFNNAEISKIDNAQNKLHEAAESLRLLQTDDTNFINSLSNKWLELDESKNILIQDNIDCQQQLDKINIMLKKQTTVQNKTKQENVVQENTNLQQNENEIVNEDSNKKYMGEFTLVAYYQGNITSTGTKPQINHTIAVDPKVIPYGSLVCIEGYGTYIAEDCGGGIKGNMIDIYMSSYNECIQFGRRKAKVYIIN